jgi:prevent-host-death family protein
MMRTDIGTHMDIISSTEARKNFAKIMDRVNKGERIAVTRQGERPVFIVSMDVYNNYIEQDETEYLMASEANRKQLLKAIEDVKAGKNLITPPANFPDDAD